MSVDLYKKLTDPFGPPGYESAIRGVIQQELSGYVDSMETDRMGSLVTVKKGNNPNRSILFMAHMDECGFMVKSVTKEGYLRFLPLGGWVPMVVLGQRVTVHSEKGPVIGVVGAKPPHNMKPEERKKTPELDDLWIDLGVSEDCNPAEEFGIRPGDPIVPYGPYSTTGNPDIHVARNWDNRVGCAALVKVMQALKETTPDVSVYGVFSVQEEHGLHGAKTAAYMTDPDIAIALDVSLAQDTPVDGGDNPAKLGAGAGIIVYNRGVVPNLGLRNRLIQLARHRQITHHLDTVWGGGYDTNAIQTVKSGVPVCVLGIPSRYIHGFGAMVHLQDIEAVTSLSLALIEETDETFIDSLQNHL